MTWEFTAHIMPPAPDPPSPCVHLNAVVDVIASLALTGAHTPRRGLVYTFCPVERRLSSKAHRNGGPAPLTHEIVCV